MCIKKVSSLTGYRIELEFDPDKENVREYLAGLRDAGMELEQINPINMASIAEQDPAGITANVKDVIALMQYLVGLRDSNLNIK